MDIMSENLIAVQIGEKWGYIDCSGEIVIEPIYEEAYEFTGGIARVEIGKKIGYINKLGQYLWELQS